MDRDSAPGMTSAQKRRAEVRETKERRTKVYRAVHWLIQNRWKDVPPDVLDFASPDCVGVNAEAAEFARILEWAVKNERELTP